MDNTAIIADDLTGAADTGIQFHPFFDETELLPYHQLTRRSKAMPPSASRATSIYTNSRAMKASAAADRVRAVGSQLTGLGFQWVYKKVDSCLRGNLGAEIEALMAALAFDASFIAPAFPKMGRITVNDIHRIHGVPVGQTEIARDPVAPVTESRLSHVVRHQCKYPVGYVPLILLNGEEEKLRDEIERQMRSGNRHLVFDAADQAHLDRIARLILSCGHKVLAVGSAGLAAGLARILPQRSSAKKHIPWAPEQGNCLMVCGTASAVTTLQIKTLVETFPYEEIILDAELLAGSSKHLHPFNSGADVQERLMSKNVVLRIGASPENTGDRTEVKGSFAPAAIVEGLSFLVASVLKKIRPGFLFVTGGDTADAVLSALDAGGIRLDGEIVPGMVHGRLCGGALNGLPVVTKAGAFGEKDALIRLHTIWQQRKGEMQ